MSADLLRRAAAKMRENAENARQGNPWIVDGDRPSIVMDPDQPGSDWDGSTVCELPSDDYGLVDHATAEHIASWHPAVALAVAKAMDDVATAWEIVGDYTTDPDGDPLRFEDSVDAGWVAVARVFLGEVSS